MKQDEMLLLFGGAFVLYLLARSSTGMTAAQSAITQTQLQAGTNVQNAQLIANAAQNLNTDIGTIADSF